MTKKLHFFILDIAFIIAIVLIIYHVIDFKFGWYFLAGDFRFNIFKELQADFFLRLISSKISTNNFIHVPFYSAYLFLQHVPYFYILIYIFFGIPILIFLSTKYILLKAAHAKNNIFYNLFFSSLAFYVAINSAVFDRYIHWTILHGTIFFPIFLYIYFRYLREKKNLNKYLLLLPLLLYFGAMTPQLVVVYFFATLIMWVGWLLLYNNIRFKTYLIRGALTLTGAVISFFHIVFPTLIGYAQAKSDYEGIITGKILAYFAKNSSIYSAISGTNFFDPLIKPPSILTAGFLIFLLCLILLTVNKKNNKINSILLFSILSIMIIITGYPTFYYIFDFMKNTPLEDFFWLAKDPNMYYTFFIILVVFLLGRLAVFSNLKKRYLISFSIFIVLLNLLIILRTDKKPFNEYYQFVKIPIEYTVLGNYLEKDPGRNLWLPSDTYVGKNFSGKMIIFPSPSWWVTKNKELVYYSTPDYKKLIMTIDNEIYEKNCKNVYFLDWIIAAQNLNIIIDRNIESKDLPKEYDVESKLKKITSCIAKLQGLYKFKTIGNIDVYKSKLKLGKGIYEYKGGIEGLNKFLKKNPSNILYETSRKESIKKVEIDSYTILNESYDKNWLDKSGNSALYKINLVSMLFASDKNNEFHYRGASGFQKAVLAQQFLLLIFVFLSLVYFLKRNPKSNKKANIKVNKFIS